MDGPSCPASPTEAGVLRRIETKNYYITAHHIKFTLEPELKRLLKTYIDLRLDSHIANSLKKGWFGISQYLYEDVHIQFSPVR